MNATPTGGAAIRDAFHRLANARENPKALAEAETWLAERLDGVALAAGPDSPDATLAALAGNKTPQDLPGLAESPRLLAFHAPLALLEGAWLQALAQPGNGHHAQTAALFAAYLALLGKDESASPAFAYRGWLARAGLALPNPKDWRFAHDPRTGLPALAFASLHLALGLHSARWFGASLGFTLGYLESTSPWRCPALPEARRQAVLSAMAGHARSALRIFLDEAGDWEQARRGQALYRLAEAEYQAAARRFAETDDPLPERVAAIFRRKRLYALGYHRAVRLGGRGLEGWLADAPFDASGFLSAFAASPYAQGEAGERPFARLCAFGGPMFGVFEPDELSLIGQWLDAGAAPPAPAAAALDSALDFAFAFASADSEPRQETGAAAMFRAWRNRIGAYKPADPRRLFHRLVNLDTGQQTRTESRDFVETVLARARRAISRHRPLRSRFFTYSHAGLAEHIGQIHAMETARYSPAEPRLRGEEYLFGLRQFAPAVLVDGCWLRYQGDAARQHSRCHRLLYRIYAEELGEGHVQWNHPKIYRDLLESLGISLPATASEAFALEPGFLDAAFDLPVYLLAIALFPETYLPETLGLNLAIELSGLGAGYLRLRDELRHWQIDPLIVSLHQSIDNLASGHSAMACEAIQIYLEEVRQLGGEAAMQAAWRRVWSGYLSLDAATGRFKRTMLFAFVTRYLPKRLGLSKAGG